MQMNQGSFSTEHTRPGRVIHLAVTASILVYAIIVEILESGLVSFERLLPDNSILGILRICFVVVGLADLAITFVVLWRPHLVGSASATFVIAYAGLDALAILGLVLFLLSGRRLDYYTFAAPALVSQVLLWTQGWRWDYLVELEQQDLEATGEEWYG
jgi:hypothetical protein